MSREIPLVKGHLNLLRTHSLVRRLVLSRSSNQVDSANSDMADQILEKVRDIAEGQIVCLLFPTPKATAAG